MLYSKFVVTAQQNGGAFKDSDWAMCTYAYFTFEAQLNISSIALYETAKNESTKEDHCCAKEEQNPTHLSVSQS